MDGCALEKGNHFDRPYRIRDAFLSFDSRHFVPGYFRNVPSGHTPKSDKPRKGRSNTIGFALPFRRSAVRYPHSAISYLRSPSDHQSHNLIGTGISGEAFAGFHAPSQNHDAIADRKNIHEIV